MEDNKEGWKEGRKRDSEKYDIQKKKHKTKMYNNNS